MTKNNLAVIILAAGKGSRMDSSIPKVIHKVNATPMIVTVLKTALKLNPINQYNKVAGNISFIGVPAEGIKFFHHTLSRPDKLQPNIKDIITWVNNIF